MHFSSILFAMDDDPPQNLTFCIANYNVFASLVPQKSFDAIFYYPTSNDIKIKKLRYKYWYTVVFKKLLS